MKLDEQEIKDLVVDTERKRANWVEWADEWERLWRLCDFNDGPKAYKDQDGIRAIVMPDTFNMVLMLQRMCADEMRIEIPSLSVKDEDEHRSQDVVGWLIAFDFESNRQQGCNHTIDKVWQSGVLGRGASRTIWTGDILPRGLQHRLPILRENLDPRNTGLSRTYYGTEWAFHKYKETRSYIENHYPKYKLEEKDKRLARQGYWNEKYTVIDFWCWHQGAVWNAVTIDDKFAKKPTKTDYPDIPIIEWYADGAPVKDEMARSLSIIHPIRGLYQAKNEFISTVATGMEYHYNPLIVSKNLGDQKIEVGPGAHIRLNGDQELQAFRAEPNVPMAQALLSIFQVGIDQATFPGVAYGDAPGGVSAGFALNNLAQQSQARAKTPRDNIEGALEAENQLILGLVEAMAPDEGVEIYRHGKPGETGKPYKLTKKIIKGNYANRVRLLPERPMDDTQKLLAWSGLAEKRLISDTFFRDEGMNSQTPQDEEVRIAVENALKSPEMQLKVQLRALQKTYQQEDWELMIVGTPLQQVHEQETQWREQKAHEQELAKAQRAEEKRQKALQEQMANMPPMMPPGILPPGNFSPMPPGLPQGGPPFDTGMPLPPPGPGAMPPPESMQPPGLPGIPPQAAGQMTPDQLGIPPGAPPGMFDQLMGGPGPSDEELLRQMGGMPPQY